MSAPGERAQLTEEEARGVVDLIRPCDGGRIKVRRAQVSTEEYTRTCCEPSGGLTLDFWLRRNFAKSADIKQAVNDVIRQLVSTGFFEEGEFPCPDNGRLCKGIRIVKGG